MSRNTNIIGGGEGYTFRNHLINGDFKIDQRNEGTSVTPTAAGYISDRWALACSVGSKLRFTSMSAINSAASVGPAINTGLTIRSGLQIYSNSAYAVSASDYFQLYQIVEGCNTADLYLSGLANYFTVSFYVYSNVPGTYGVSLYGGATRVSYVHTYNVPVANVWTFISFSVPNPGTAVAGSWPITVGSFGLQMAFDLGAGSNYQTSNLNTWQNGMYFTGINCTNVVGNSGIFFYLTGVQIEQGGIPTSFEIRPYDVELARCQRYFEKSYDVGKIPGSANTYGGAALSLITGLTSQKNTACINSYYKTTKMINPTLIFYSPTSGASGKLVDQTNGVDIVASVQQGGFNGHTVVGNASSASTQVFFQYHWIAQSEL